MQHNQRYLRFLLPSQHNRGVVEVCCSKLDLNISTETCLSRNNVTVTYYFLHMKSFSEVCGSSRVTRTLFQITQNMCNQTKTAWLDTTTSKRKNVFEFETIQQVIYRTCYTSYDLPKIRTPYVPSLALEGRELVLCGGWLQLVSVKSPARLWLRSRLRRP